MVRRWVRRIQKRLREIRLGRPAQACGFSSLFQRCRPAGLLDQRPETRGSDRLTGGNRPEEQDVKPRNLRARPGNSLGGGACRLQDQVVPAQFGRHGILPDLHQVLEDIRRLHNFPPGVEHLGEQPVKAIVHGQPPQQLFDQE